jgi:hypothetical protein
MRALLGWSRPRTTAFTVGSKSYRASSYRAPSVKPSIYLCSTLGLVVSAGILCEMCRILALKGRRRSLVQHPRRSRPSRQRRSAWPSRTRRGRQRLCLEAAGRFPRACRASGRISMLLLVVLGVVPVAFRKTSVKWLWLAKPRLMATSMTDSRPRRQQLPAPVDFLMGPSPLRSHLPRNYWSKNLGQVTPPKGRRSVATRAIAFGANGECGCSRSAPTPQRSHYAVK